MDQMRLYDAVKHAQDIAIDMVCDSVEFGQISSEVFHFFDSIGFKTDIKSNHPCGMFHSLGHGFGLDLHESTGDTLKSGMTITIEPGLYYQNIGGIRIEDDVLVHDDGCEILSNIPYDFVIE